MFTADVWREFQFPVRPEEGGKPGYFRLVHCGKAVLGLQKRVDMDDACVLMVTVQVS